MRLILPLLILLATLAFVLSPVLSTGFSGFTADQFPVPQPDPPIQPMGLTFAVIWTVIYGWLIVMSLYGLLRRAAAPDWAPHRPWLLASVIIGAAWIPVANASPIWALVLIWAMLGTTLRALWLVPARDRFWLQAPVGLYAGWLTAAAPVGTAVVATGYGATPEIWVHAAFLLLASWIAYAVARFSSQPRPFYLVAVLWGVLGIVIDNIAVERWLFAGLAGAVMLVLVPVFARHVRGFALR